MVSGTAKFYGLEKISKSSDDYSYGTSLFDALLYDRDKDLADETPNIVEDNTPPEINIDDEDSAVPPDVTPVQRLVRRSGRIRQEPV